MTNPQFRVSRGPPTDPHRVTRRAHQQPRTDMTRLNRGQCQQPRTGMLHANRGKTNKIVNICSYNTNTINDLNSDVFDTMIHELENVNWSIVGLAETKERDIVK